MRIESSSCGAIIKGGTHAYSYRFCRAYHDHIAGVCSSAVQRCQRQVHQVPRYHCDDSSQTKDDCGPCCGQARGYCTCRAAGHRIVQGCQRQIHALPACGQACRSRSARRPCAQSCSTCRRQARCKRTGQACCKRTNEARCWRTDQALPQCQGPICQVRHAGRTVTRHLALFAASGLLRERWRRWSNVRGCAALQQDQTAAFKVLFAVNDKAQPRGDF